MIFFCFSMSTETNKMRKKEKRLYHFQANCKDLMTWFKTLTSMRYLLDSLRFRISLLTCSKIEGQNDTIDGSDLSMAKPTSIIQASLRDVFLLMSKDDEAAMTKARMVSEDSSPIVQKDWPETNVMGSYVRRMLIRSYYVKRN